MTVALNKAQQQAVEAGDGPVVIIAGPGTGKTKTLTARILHLIANGVPLKRILALTFTKKAAAEMRERLGDAANGADVMTFHALCHSLLGGEQTFISEPARLQLIKKLPRPAALKGVSVRELALRLSRAKNMAEDDPDIAKLLTAYNTALRKQGVIDFDDLLVHAKELLSTEATRKELQSRYEHILVDEFQDTNRLQYELLQLLRGNDNVFVIGDPEQSIYGFRGASGDIFGQFAADFPDHTLITLTTNYRSTPAVVRLSNAIAADAPNLTSHSTGDGLVRVVQVLNEYSEAAWVVNEIQRAIGGADLLRAISDDERSAQRNLTDFAVLYRSRNAAIAVQKAIASSGLPYQIAGDGSPYDTPELQALIALFKAAVTGKDPELEGFTATERKAVLDLLGDTTHAVPRAVGERLVQVLGLEVTPEIQQFINTLVGCKDLAAAVRYFDEIAEHGYYDPRADSITLMTIHASKGLEFSHVFLVGAEEGLLPSLRADEAEERRLFYVAATRAKHRLDILHAKSRGGQPAQLSRFAQAIPDVVLPKITDPGLVTDAKRAKLRAIKRSQQTLF